MPAYSNTFPPYSVAPGEQTSSGSNLVDPADGTATLGAGNFSQRVAIQDVFGAQPRPVTITFTYASAPASVQYDIYAAWDDTAPLVSYTKVGTTNNVNGDQVTIQRTDAGGPNFRFLCVKEVTSPGVKTTVKVQQ